MSNLALLGTHEEDTSFYKMALEVSGYGVDVIEVTRDEGIIREDQQEMANRMINAFLKKPYEVVLMDANLGEPGNAPIAANEFYYSDSIKPSIQSRVENGQLVYICFSGLPNVVREARSHGIPSELNTELAEKISKLINKEISPLDFLKTK